LDAKGNFIPSNYVIPFSVGPRHCLGEQLAKMELFFFLVGLVQKFELSAENYKKLPDINDFNRVLVLTPLPYKMVAK